MRYNYYTGSRSTWSCPKVASETPNLAVSGPIPLPCAGMIGLDGHCSFTTARSERPHLRNMWKPMNAKSAIKSPYAHLFSFEKVAVA